MEYKAPLRDMRFVLHELFDATGHCELLGNGLDRELIDGVLEDALAYVMQRKAFGRYIGEFQALQHYIADIATMQKTTELLLHFCASKQARGEPVGNEANMLKLHASEAANQAADLGIQMLGGMGYSAETDMQRYWRDSRLWRIGPITNEMVKNGIAQSLGLPRSY